MPDPREILDLPLRAGETTNVVHVVAAFLVLADLRVCLASAWVLCGFVPCVCVCVSCVVRVVWVVCVCVCLCVSVCGLVCAPRTPPLLHSGFAPPCASSTQH